MTTNTIEKKDDASKDAFHAPIVEGCRMPKQTIQSGLHGSNRSTVSVETVVNNGDPYFETPTMRGRKFKKANANRMAHMAIYGPDKESADPLEILCQAEEANSPANALRDAQKILLTMPDPYRQVLIMRNLDHKDFKTIAEKLGMNPSTVRSTYTRGMAMFQERFDNRASA